MTTIINASTSSGLVQTADGSGIIKVQSNGVTTNALAWVNFNGTTSPGTIRSSYNVTSVTKSATGRYSINFTNTLADANYASVIGFGDASATSTQTQIDTTSRTTSVCAINGLNAAGTAFQDISIVTVAIFGN